MKRKIICLTVCLLAMLGLHAGYLGAQATFGTIQGTVTTSAGSPMPNAKIELVSEATGVRMSAITNNRGEYRFDNVPVGRYRIVPTAGQVTATPTQEFDVEVGKTNAVNLSVPVGPATDTAVSAELLPVDMTTAQIFSNYNTRWIHYLPQSNFVGRRGEAQGAYNLSLLSPGLTSGGGEADGPAVAGQRPMSNAFHMDGIDNNNKVEPGSLVYVSNEASTEFALYQNQFTPVFGHAMGGKFNTVVRTGTNQFHGQLYNYLQNRHLNAMDQRLRRLGFDENPRYDQNRLGVAAGVPVIPSKMFLFGNFEYIPLGFTDVPGGISFAPTTAGFNTLANMRGISATNLGILRSAVGDVNLESGQFAMVAGTAIPLGIANSAIRGWQNQYMGTGAMDFNISPADQLRFRYVHNRLQSNDSGANLPFFNTGRDRTSLLASISHYHSFGSRVQNELRVGYNRFNQRFHDGSFDFPGVDVFPTIQLQEANLTLGPNLGFAQESVWNTYHVADGVSINANRHNLRIGFDGRRYIASRNGLASSRGQFGFSSLERFLLDVSPDIASERSFGDIGFSPNQWLLFGYVQDNWVVHRKVHVNLGLRYEYVTLPTGMKLQDLNSQAGVPGVLEFSRPRIENRMFAPNVGIAVSPFETTVIRAGFGMSYDALYSSFWPIGIAPVMGRTAFGNLMTDQIGFFRSGGLTATPFDQNATPAQIRSGITTFFGEQELPYSLQWNAGVQQGLGRRTTLEVKYLGSRGMHLPVWTRLNDPMRVTADRSLPLFFQTPTQAQLNALNLTLADVQRLQPNAFTTAGFTSPITTIDPGGKSWYHAGTAALRTNFTGGVQLFGAYTWSHLIEDSTGTPMDLAFPTRIRSESFYDRRHRLTATWLWDVAGAFSNTSSWVRNIIADLKLSGTYTFESAPWITALAGRDLTLSGFGGFSTPAFVNTEATGFGGSGVTPLRNRNNQIVAYQVTDPSARFISGAPGVFFNPRRGSFPLRDINNWDVSVAKGFSWRERLSFEIRADAYNLFNHTEFSTSNIRSIEAQPLAPLFLIPGNPEFGNIEGNIASNSRILQLALRLTF